MKTLYIVIFFLLLKLTVLGQPDMYNNIQTHIFPCDTGKTTYDRNRCSGIKRDYFDSTMKLIFNKIDFALESEITDLKVILKQELSKKDSIVMRKVNLSDLTKSIEKLKSLKDDLVKSQKVWEKERDHNVRVISALVEGGSGFVEFENQSLIDDTLERISKLLTFMNFGIPSYLIDNTIRK
jgi:uncharacterized protein YecT (DUF1311 family)